MGNASFLPEDYIAQRAERRSSVISLTLFGVVMTAVVAAFFVTNRQWKMVKLEQQQINLEFAEAAKRIEELNELEARKAQLLSTAEITAALVERIPRSVLLAELINRMPDAVSLDEFELKSIQIKTAAPASTAKDRVKSLAEKKRGPTKADEATERKVEAPKYDVTITLEGFAPTDVHVSEYITNLNLCPLVREVELKHTKGADIDGQELREFQIEMKLDNDADAKQFEPLRANRSLRDPTMAEVELDSFDPDLTQVDFDGEEPH
ncbi:MAG: PilN domain-containing protein [Phycisphaerales bacterium]